MVERLVQLIKLGCRVILKPVHLLIALEHGHIVFVLRSVELVHRVLLLQPQLHRKMGGFNVLLLMFKIAIRILVPLTANSHILFRVALPLVVVENNYILLL